MTGQGVLLPIRDSNSLSWGAHDDVPWMVWIFGQDYEYFQGRLASLPSH
ncbi:hypothetical protein CCP2SC5_1610006 [Azospirillaceae bacterium]